MCAGLIGGGAGGDHSFGWCGGDAGCATLVGLTNVFDILGADVEQRAFLDAFDYASLDPLVDGGGTSLCSGCGFAHPDEAEWGGFAPGGAFIAGFAHSLMIP